tara:strand:- start:66 stop:1220 length:1155 start_codon:yes stop_codon:yes gene_type:complete
MIFYNNKKKKILLFIKKLTTKNIKIKFILFIQEFLYLLRLKIIFSVFLKRKNIFKPKIFKNPIFLYDLRCSSLTFDFADYLFLTNLWLKKFGYEKCDCIIFGGFENIPLMKFRSYDLAINKNELWERIDNVIKPLAERANFINSIKLISDVNSLRNILKESFLVFPPHYINLESQNIYLEGVPENRLEILTNNKKNLTHLVKFLKPDLNDINHVKKKLQITEADKIVTFTVRDYKFEEVRNTNYSYLKNLSKFFASKGYRFIVLPDHKNQSPNIKEEIYVEATLDLRKRIALYYIANINIGTAGGPSWMARYIPNTNMFITNILKDGKHYGSFRDLKKLHGRGLKWNKQSFLDTDMHIIFGPEDDISNLTSYERIKKIIYYDNL